MHTIKESGKIGCLTAREKYTFQKDITFRDISKQDKSNAETEFWSFVMDLFIEEDSKALIFQEWENLHLKLD